MEREPPLVKVEGGAVFAPSAPVEPADLAVEEAAAAEVVEYA